MSKVPSKTGILLAAFGSSSPLGEKALTLFSQEVRKAFPGIPVRWAYTSDRMRSRLAAVGKKTDSVKKALRRMGFERYTHVAVQSLHLIPGLEYEALLEESGLAGKEGGPRHISVGLPLLHTAEDVRLAARALLDHLPLERAAEEPVICMGHGAWHAGAAGYQALAERIAEHDARIFIGTLEGERAIDALLPAVAACVQPPQQASTRNSDSLAPESRPASASPPVNPHTVWLLPLLSIIGKHAEQDMAGEHPHSWRGKIEAAGFRCRPVLKGTVEYPGFAGIWLDHLARAMDFLRR